VYIHSRTVYPRPSCALFVWLSVCSFPGMPECPGTQWITTSMPWAWRALACSLIALASCCPGPGSRCAVCLMAAGESLKTAAVVTPCAHDASAFAMDFLSATPNAHCLPSKSSICPVPRLLRNPLQPFPFTQTAGGPTLSSSVPNLSVQHVQVPDPDFLPSLSPRDRRICWPRCHLLVWWP